MKLAEIVGRRDRAAGPKPSRMSRAPFVPGKLVVRFKPEALSALAARPMARSLALAEKALPPDVAGPLEQLRSRGIKSIRPLFPASGRAPRVVEGAAAGSVRRLQSLTESIVGPRRERLRGFQVIELPEKSITNDLLRALRASRAVEIAERVPNRWLAATPSTSDPQRNLQWGLRTIRWFQADRKDASVIHVAILDTGVDAGHPDLKGAVDEYRHDGNTARDFHGHGTHVAGIIAAATNNGVGIAGVANCRLHCWKVFNDPDRSGELGFNDDYFANALAALLDSKVRVVNLSLGGTESSETERILFGELAGAGILAVAAMGNEFDEGNPVEYPAGYSSVLAVGAIAATRRRARFSNTGAHIGIVAPGEGILSTLPMQTTIDGEREYGAWDGTSMATPFVVGGAALVLAKGARGKADPRILARRLKSTAAKVPAMHDRNFTREYGYGLLNLEKALA